MPQKRNAMPPRNIFLSDSVETSVVAKQEFAALESRYEALLLENARLASENMRMMQNAQLLQESMRRQCQMAYSKVPTPQQWPAINPFLVSPPPGLAPDSTSETLAKSCMKLSLAAHMDTLPTGCNSFSHSRVSSRTESTYAASHALEASSDEDFPETEQPKCATGNMTTVMMKCLPANISNDQLLSIIDAEGFAGSYDFFYLPVDFKNLAGLGYCFVNFEEARVAECFLAHFQGFSSWGMQSERVCLTTWSEALQGRNAHIERYRNSPVMHPSMPDHCKPKLFENGKPITFPAPTARIRAPRYHSGRA